MSHFILFSGPVLVPERGLFNKWPFSSSHHLDDVPAPPAPFNHRIVTAKQAAINSFYTVSRTEILGG